MRLGSFVMAALLAAARLAAASPDIAVIELSGDNVFHPPNSRWRQMVVQAEPRSSTFTTLVKTDEDPKSFILRTYDLRARSLGESRIPRFTESPGSAWEYALSPDGSKFVLKRNGDLILLNLTDRSESVLWADAVTKHGPDIEGIFWISDRKFVIVIGVYNDRERNQVTLVDAATGERKLLYRPVDPSGLKSAALSPDRRFLAFADSTFKPGLYKAIKLLDLESGELAATVGRGTLLMGPMQWSHDGSELAFVEGGEIKVWRRSDRRIRQLTDARRNFVIYRLIFPPGRIGYVGGDTGSNHFGFFGLFGGKDLVLIDAETGAEIRKIRKEFNGRLFYLEAANSVVAEVGY